MDKGVGTKKTRAQKSLETREKIMDAGRKLLAKYGYEQLTIRNICSEAGVTNGTFYHFFKNKDELMASYLHVEDWADEVEDPENLGEYILHGYLKLTDLYQELGIEFTSGYYSAKNQAFNIYTRGTGAYISDYYRPRLYRARDLGYVRDDVSVDRIVADIIAIFIGCVFQWCVVFGSTDIKMDVRRMLSSYLDYYVFTPKYFEMIEQKKAGKDKNQD